MTYLLLSLVALAAGPVLLGGFRRGSSVTMAIDGFVVTAVPLLVFFQFVPSAIDARTPGLLVAVAVGVVLPVVLERLMSLAGAGVHRWGLLMALVGLAVHASLDGSALAIADRLGNGWSFPMAVVLHRLPVGVVVWWLVSRTFGTRGAALALGAIMAATAAGYGAGMTAARLMALDPWLTLFQAAVAGFLVHVAMHRPPGGQDGRPRAEAVGALFAVGVVIGATLSAYGGHDHGGPGGHGPQTAFLVRLLALAAESAPALLIAYLAAGLLSAYLPMASVRWLGGGGGLGQAGRGMLVGLPFPICSCGVVPLYRSLVARGAPPAAAMAFLVATPELGLDAVMLSIPLLGGHVTLMRLGTAAGAALLVGWWVGGRLDPRPAPNPETNGDGVARAGWSGVGTALRIGTGEVVDHTAPWILLGLVVAALVAPWLEGGWLGQLPPVAGVLFFAALGFPTYVCAASATPVVAALLAAGLSPGAGIAFLITGPATNISTLGVVSSLHGREAALRFAGTLVGFAVAAGIFVDFVFPSVAVPSLAELTEEAPNVVEWVALVGLCGLVLASVLRRGIRRFCGELRDGLGWTAGHDHHDHDHDHHHHHHHAPHDHSPSHGTAGAGVGGHAGAKLTGPPSA